MQNINIVYDIRHFLNVIAQLLILLAMLPMGIGCQTNVQTERAETEGFIVLDNLDDFKKHINQDNIKSEAGAGQLSDRWCNIDTLYANYW